MTPTRKRVLLFAFTGLLLTANAIVVRVGLNWWGDIAWVGMMAMPSYKDDKPGVMDGLIYWIFPGSPAERAGIRKFDRLVAINGIPACECKRVSEFARAAKSDDTLLYRIKRGHDEFEVPLRLEPRLGRKQVVVSIVTTLIAGLSFFLIAFLVYLKRLEDRRAFIFYVMSVALGTGFLVGGMLEPLAYRALRLGIIPLDGTMTIVVLGGPLIFYLTILLMALLLHFALVFPLERPLVGNYPILIWIYGLPIVLLLLLVLLIGFARFPPSNGARILSLLPIIVVAIFLLAKCRTAVKASGWKRGLIFRPVLTMTAFTTAFWAPLFFFTGIVEFSIWALALPEVTSRYVGGVVWGGTYGGLSLMLLVLIPLYTVAACVALFRSYRESGVEEKRQLKWPLWGTIVAISVSLALSVLLSALPFAGGRLGIPASMFFIGETLTKVLYLLIPVSFAFAILKYRLMDIDLIIRKTVLYTILTGVIVVLYLALAGGLGGLLVRFTGIESQWVTIFSTLVIVGVFVPVRSRIQSFVERRFFRRKYDYPQALRIISHEIAGAVELKFLLKVTCEHLQQALQNRSVIIFHRGSRDQNFQAAAKVGLSEEILDKLRFEPKSRFLGMLDGVVDARQGELPEDEKQKLKRASSALVVPVRLKSELVAFISLGTKLSDEDYDAEDTEFLEEVAGQLASGINNLRLQKQEEELEGAREIQQGLLPKEVPQVRGYQIAGAWQPARIVGGDYFDVLKFDESKIALCIADVVGKGMTAALLMANLQAAVKAFATESVTPHELCVKVNRVICSNIAPGKFITFFYCLLDAAEKRLIYTSAGHNPPILLRPDRTVIRLQAGGPVLGVFPECVFEQGEIELRSGDTLLLFTDGVTEVTNNEDEEFGEDRLIEVLSENRALGALEIQKKVMETVTEFSDGNFQDDSTLLAMSIEAND